MSEFYRSIHQLERHLSFTSIRDIAIDGLSRLPRCEQDRLHEELVRGTAVLDDEPHMNMYLRSFGLMHKAKIDEAFNIDQHTVLLFLYFVRRRLPRGVCDTVY